MKIYRKMILVALIAAAGNYPASAGQTILVTADRFPGLITGASGSVDVIEHQDIINSGQDELSSLLEEKLDIVILRSGIASASGVALRGVSGGGMNNKIRLYVDGMPVNTLRKGFNLESIDLRTVERIEVIRGPASALYGGGALVGVINIVTSPVEKTTVAGAGAGSYGTRKGNFILADEKGRFSYRINSALLDTDGHITEPGTTEPRNTARIINTGAMLNYTAGKDLLSFSARDFRTERDSAEFSIGGSSPGTYSGQTKDIREWSGFYALNYRHSFDQSRLLLKVFNVRDEEKSSILPRETAENRGASIQFEKRFSDTGMLFSGLDLEKHYLHADAGGLTFRRNYSAPYLHMVMDIFPEKLTLTAGARYDMPDEFDNRLSPKIGLVYKVSGKLQLRGGLSHGFRYPTVTDLYSTTSPLGNSALKSEKSKNMEAGADYSNGGIEISCSVFKMVINDMIISRLISAGPPKVKQYFNVAGESPYKGLELQSSWTFTRNLSAGAGYSYLDPGDLTFHTDRHRFKASLALHNVKHRIELNGSYAKNRYLWDNEVGDRDNYELYSLLYTMRFNPKAKFYVKILNLGDEEYFVNFYDPEPGRHFMAGIEYEL